MIDAAVVVREYLLSQPEVTSLLGTNANGSIYAAYDLPEHFNPTLGPAIQLFRAGGHSHIEISGLLDARVQIRVWADVEEYTTASTVYGAINDALHGLCGATLTDGTIVRALEVEGPLEMTDPETGWVAMYAFYQVMGRANGSSTPYTPQFYEGYGPPTTLDNNDDIYYDEASGNLWEQVAGSWVLVGNIPVGGGGSEMPSSVYHKVAASGVNAANIKASSGIVTGWNIFNDTEFPIYVRLFNLATAPTVGSSEPLQTIAIQGGETAEAPPNPGVTYSTGIAIAITGGLPDLDGTSVTANSCVVDIFYQ